MNEPTIDQMNEAMALFMGLTPRFVEYPNKQLNRMEVWSNNHSVPMEYHSSWDWLMEVVEKIAALDGGKYNFHISSTGQWACYIDRDDVFDSEITSYGGYEPMIINVYKAVFTFIEWYNKLNQK